MQRLFVERVHSKPTPLVFIRHVHFVRFPDSAAQPTYWSNVRDPLARLRNVFSFGKLLTKSQSHASCHSDSHRGLNTVGRLIVPTSDSTIGECRPTHIRSVFSNITSKMATFNMFDMFPTGRFQETAARLRADGSGQQDVRAVDEHVTRSMHP